MAAVDLNAVNVIADYDDKMCDLYDNVTQSTQHKYVMGYTLMSLAGDLQGLSCLEIGCGNGDYMTQLYEKGAVRIAGADLSKENLVLAERKHKEKGVPQNVMSYLQTNLTQPSQIADGSFDVALCACVVCYSEDRDALIGFMKTASTNLKQGGRFVCVNTRMALPLELRDELVALTGNKYSVQPEKPYSSVELEWANGWKAQTSYVPADEVKSAMIEAGFEVTEEKMQADPAFKGNVDMSRLLQLLPYDAFIGIKK
jgi:ubiquinone/menaquinone biosynthesis C-methylase UbiE